jgi:primase-polymerase (primpol)-like protein
MQPKSSTAKSTLQIVSIDDEDDTATRAEFFEKLSQRIAAKASQNWLLPDFENILPQLKALPNWVLAQAVIRNGKVTKPPVQPNGAPASHSNPSTWSAFSTVKAAYQRGGFIGVGFVLDGQPHFGGRYLHGFDWDHCIVDGQLDPEVEKTVQGLNIPRLETSISGTGLRGFFLHDEPLQSRKTHINGRSVELYSTSRYMTTTGRGKGALE